ncbi:very short patch repair endonuclease [Sphingobium sp. SYK-6]|uniref:very short patch repair endonuclease n=1 Tax=Sphingobium sp. (strain NBRC 103272 / SYK-6) TaxID=627192 RepID=UPI0002276F7B|nr:DNA mismatch endonuclease Vsr [Sphingobium sp. SYK-6]BAK67355.1 very short patch repair endonuclease [Sphingobium sp. SYK-6]
MVDRLTPERRSWLMSRVRGKSTMPEMAVRRMAHAMGMRFRLHRRDLPGRPDLVFPRYRTVLFVHGCFWHRHAGCRKATSPKSRTEYWQAKFEGNVARDERNETQLIRMGWRVLTIWECDTKDSELLREKLESVRSIRGGKDDGLD